MSTQFTAFVDQHLRIAPTDRTFSIVVARRSRPPKQNNRTVHAILGLRIHVLARRRRPARPVGFTLVELLIVVAIVAVLAMIAAP